MEAAAPDAAPFLPQGVVAVLLPHVGRRERLRACALVCRAWRAAAAAATSSVSVPRQHADSIAAWLASNGPQLTALELVGTHHHWEARPVLQLAWERLAGLRQLSVQECDLGSSDSSGPSSLRCLTSLRLEECTLAWPGGLAALAVLTALQQLELSGVAVPDSTSEQAAASLGSTLCQLRQLTRLELRGDGLAADAALAPSLSRLAQLRELECRAGTDLTAASFAASLPAPLTRLVCSSQSLQLSASSSPGLAQLAGLQRLELPDHGGFELALLDGWPALRHLCLRCERWLPPDTQPGAGASALLAAALAQLPSLEHLQLSGSLPDAPAAAYSALVAPSALTCLDVGWCHLPAACAASLFGRPLPRLRRLLLLGPEAGIIPWETQHLSAFTASGVVQVAACCSQLQELQLHCNEVAGEALAPLTALARLTGLRASGRCVDNWAARHVLPALTSLRRLSLESPHALTWPGLLPLTALQQLEQLHIACCGYFTNDSEDLELAARPGALPVWQQLQGRCRWNPDCRLAIAQEQAVDLAAQLSEAEAQADQLLQAASDAWRHAAQLLQQLAQGNGATQQAQQQLAGQRARADELLQQAMQAQGQAGQLLERATQLAADAYEQLLESDLGMGAGPLAVLDAQAAGLAQQAGQLQERGAAAAAAAHLGMVQQLLEQAERLAEQA